MGKKNKSQGATASSSRSLSSSSVKKREKSRGKDDGVSMIDWIAQLAKTTAAEETISAGGAAATSTAVSSSKAERIEKREAKKRKRGERKAAFANIKKSSNAARTEGVGDGGIQDAEENSNKKVNLNKKILRQLAAKLEEKALESQSSSLKLLSLEFEKDMKAARIKKRKWDEESIQPRARDYGGIGLARQSLFLRFQDPSFIPKLEDEFSEHIPGFYGKQRTKLMKKQANTDMLWKKLRVSKGIKSSDPLLDKKVHGKKLQDMKPDERVEAMIKAGLI